MISKTHHYFLLNFSPWAFLLSASSFNLLFSLLIFFKFSTYSSFSFSLILIIWGTFLWWMNYKKEFSYQGLNTSDLEMGVKMAMILFISSEIFFFFSFFWSYFHYYLSPGLENGFEWPPVGILAFDALNVPFLNTLILLSSGVLVTLSHWFLTLGKMKLSNLFLSLTIILGILFTFFQGQEYLSSFYCISDGNYGTSFFMLTGFHGIHVLIGSIFLFIVLMFSMNMNNKNSNSLSFELASWYWHFVDVVWIFLFFFLYYLNN